MFQQDVFQGPGTGTFTTHTFEILFMLLVAGLIGLWLGWVLWSKYRQEAEKLRLENTSLSATNIALRTEADDLKARLATLESDQASLENRIKTLTWEADTQSTQFTILQSDMEKILARNRQLESELGLSLEPETAVSESIPLEIDTQSHAGIAVEISEPEPEQPAPTPEVEEKPTPAPELVATTAPDGESVVFVEPVSRESMIPISELGDAPVLQTPVPEPEQQPAAEAAPLVAAITGGPRDDLKIVEGIGPKIEQLLFNAGITTYGQLAATSVQQLKDILAEAGSRYVMHDPGTWSAQALLAANGEWENLKAYQDFLNAGKRPDKN
ncbi:MAG: hypothetical protein JNJ90_15330 [Saprospiraceae bacterium]|jgi:predicted flap endonuclease-1-like 5' DNA nuclease|nr:hypothetical protein [Saprospiraceae bacterium]